MMLLSEPIASIPKRATSVADPTEGYGDLAVETRWDATRSPRRASAAPPPRGRRSPTSTPSVRDLDADRAPGHVPVVSGEVRSPGGGARCATWFRYASPAIHAATI